MSFCEMLGLAYSIDLYKTTTWEVVAMVIKIHELLLFLLLLWLFVANLATGSWQPSFRRPRNLRAFRDARRSAYSGQPGGWQMMDPKDRLAKQIARSAAKQANVIASHVVQAFFKVRSVSMVNALRTSLQRPPHLLTHVSQFTHICRLNF